MPGADINAYQGNAAIAQGTTGNEGGYGVYEPKNTNDAIDKFMMYQFYENRDKWARANIEKDQQAAQTAQDLTFKLGDFLGPDNKSILDKIGEFNSFYVNNPDAVKLKTDATGKIINGEQHTQWLNYRSEIDSMIARANGRKTQADTLAKQVGSFTDPTKRTAGEAFYNKMISTPIDQDILLFPDLAVWNPKDMVVPPISFDQSEVLPNEIKNTNFKLADVNSGLSNFIIQMTAPENETMRDTVNGFLQQYNGTIDKVKQGHPDASEDDFKNLLRGEANGEAIVQLYDNMNNYLDFYNSDKVTQYTKKQPIPKVTLSDGLDQREMGLLLMTNSLTTNQATSFVHTGDELNRLNINKDFEAQMAGIAQRREEANKGYELQKEAAGLKNNDALANDKANLYMDVLGTPLKQDAKRNQDGSFYVAPDPLMENIFEKQLPAPIKIKTAIDPNDPEAGYTEQNISKYDITAIGINPSQDKDPNNSTVTVEYRNPQTKKYSHETFSAQRFWNLSNNLYGATNAEKVSKASSAYLKKEYSLDQPNFQKMANNFKLSAGDDTQGIPDLPANGQGQINVGDLKSGQTYLYKGTKVQWNGTRLIPVK